MIKPNTSPQDGHTQDHPEVSGSVEGIRLESTLCMQVKQRLCLDNRHLIRKRMKRMDVQFVTTCFKVNIAKRLQPASCVLRKCDKHPPIPREPLQIRMALAVQVGAHLFNLKIGHVVQTPAQGAFVGPLSPELESLDQTTFGQQHAVGADQFRQAHIAGKHADHVRASRGPQHHFVMFGFEMSATENREQFRMQRPLKQRKRQLTDSYIGIRRLHSSPVLSNDQYFSPDYNKYVISKSRPLIILKTGQGVLIGRKFRKDKKENN